MTRTKLPSLAVLVAILLISGQIALYAFMWFRLLGDPSLKTMDFVNFYAIGRLIRMGEYGQIYNYNIEASTQHQIVGGDYKDPLIFNHPPHVTPLLALIASDNYVRAYIYWSVARLLVMLACGELVRRWLVRCGWQAGSAWLGALGWVTFFPLFIGLLGGQDTVFTLIGLLVWMLALLKGREVAAGLGLAFATLSPIIAGALALPLLASRRRASLWFMLGSLILLFYSLLLVGVQGIKDLLHLLQISSQGQMYGFYWALMYNLFGFLVRAFPGLDIDVARIIIWIIAIASILSMCILWWNKRNQLRMEHIGIAVVLGTLTAPHLYLHALSYLLLPLLAAITLLHQRGHQTLAVLLIPLTSTLALLSIFMDSEINFAVYYALMLALIVGLSLSLRQTRPQVEMK